MSSFASALDHLAALGAELAAPNAPRRKFDLAHMRTLTRALGDPQDRFRSVLIAGTNGKGSTAATLAHILAAAGLRTALYTSPHLVRVTERIRTNTPPSQSPESPHPPEGRHSGAPLQDLRISPAPEPQTFSPPSIDLSFRPEARSDAAEQPASAPAQASRRTTPTLLEIPEPTFARLFFQVDETARTLVAQNQLPHPPSYFEVLTALAFLYFAEQQIDLAVLEVGLGGRLDATNIVHPTLAILTDIALDHQDYLGPTIRDIAREKAGILRQDGILVTLPQHPEANQAIGEAAVPLNVRAINAADYLPARNFSPPDLEEHLSFRPERSAVEKPASAPAQPNDPTGILSFRPERSVVEKPASAPAQPNDPTGTLSFRPERSEVEKPASAPAQPNDPTGTLSFRPERSEVEKPASAPAHSSDPTGILSFRPERSAVEKPASAPAQPNDPTGTLSFRPERSVVEKPASAPAHSSDPTGTLSFRPERSEVEKPASLPATETPTTPLPPNTYTLHLDNTPLHIASPLPGEHQQRNLALAIAAAVELRSAHNLPIPNSAMEAGIRNTAWPGRLEFLPPNLLLDVAHNPAGAWTLRAALSRLPDSQPRTLLFSCLRDKDLREIAQILFPLFDSPTPTVSPASRHSGATLQNLSIPSPTSDLSFRPERSEVEKPASAPAHARAPQHHIILTAIDSPRAATLDQLAATAAALDVPAHTAPTPAEALALARSLTPTNGLIVATGSIYLIGTIRDLATSTPAQ